MRARGRTDALCETEAKFCSGACLVGFTSQVSVQTEHVLPADELTPPMADPTSPKMVSHTGSFHAASEQTLLAPSEAPWRHDDVHPALQVATLPTAVGAVLVCIAILDYSDSCVAWPVRVPAAPSGGKDAS